MVCEDLEEKESIARCHREFNMPQTTTYLGMGENCGVPKALKMLGKELTCLKGMRNNKFHFNYKARNNLSRQIK